LQVVQTRTDEVREFGGSSLFSISWKIAGDQSSEMLEAHLDSVAPSVRKSLIFLAPDVSVRANPRITLLSFARKNHEVNAQPDKRTRYGNAIMMAAGVVLCGGLAFTNLWTYRNLQEVRELAQDRDQAYRRLERDLHEKIDEQKEFAAVAVEDAKSRMAIDSLSKLKELLNSIYREASSDTAMERDIKGIRHYLEMQGSSTDYKASLSAVLDNWIKFEKSRNTQKDFKVEQQRIANELKKTLSELRGLIDKVNSIKSRVTLNQTEARTVDSEKYVKIEEATTRLKTLIDAFENIAELR
jgi:hypothetical protein